ncbi:phosphotransferase [Streptomyces hoynatensis]|uniref:Aminoglycoside phosphotransferase n=1 Tax=Streptomyces hoynatensis TaxID=1141874 RepID=A0A3A9Z7C1_9ACTN|nr:phosphotransferase [Streptomyces hoynatensis]RKN43136.1 aminoglycoside phosphotransferase [Streptomyces hoynatensis]
MRLPERTLTDLLRRYGIGEPLACEALTTGLLNRGYRVATTRGEFFLKHHLDGDPLAQAPLLRQHRATAALAELGLPVAPPLADREGRTVVVHDDRCYALHPWVEGRHRDGGQLSRAQSRRLGALLGRVHRALEQVIGRAPFPRASRRAAAPAETDARIDQLLARLRGRARRTAFDELAEHRLLERRALLRAHAHLRPRREEVPAEGWVHGDFHPLNLLYRAEGPVEPVAIVDWDRLDVQPRAEEAVRAAAIFFLRPDGGLDLPKVRAYARAYRTAAGASPTELAAAVRRVWWERLNDFWMLGWHYERQDRRADPQFPAAAALVVWWTRHALAVSDAFCD